jgi:hypothetical protein
MGIAILPAQEKKVKKSVASLKAKREKTINPKKKKTKKKTGGRTKSNQDMSNAQLLKQFKELLLYNPVTLPVALGRKFGKKLLKSNQNKKKSGGKVSRKK